jgi:hypothetical protein
MTEREKVGFGYPSGNYIILKIEGKDFFVVISELERSLDNPRFEFAVWKLLDKPKNTKCIVLLRWIVVRISDLIPSKDLELMASKLESWMARADYKVPDVWTTRREVSKLLSDKYYSKMQMNIIPTATLEGSRETPDHKEISDELSNKLS